MDVWIVIDDAGSISGVYTTREIAREVAIRDEFDPDDAVEHWEVSKTAGNVK